MIFFLLAFLHSWLWSIFMVLMAGFFYYEHFNLVDIAVFATFLFAGALLIVPFIYYPCLRWLNKKIESRRIIPYSMFLLLMANMPAYMLVWWKSGDLYGQGEAWLFCLGLATLGIAFGFCNAWKRARDNQAQDFRHAR